ncbi:MAG: hypothetical protein J4G04_07890 [Nitrosopumilaceae archaeon]|nr:hypothetical protein [Nitrosopumilaceae archaeon]
MHRIPADRIKTEHAIRIYRGGGVVIGPANRKRISRIRGRVHTPDIVVVDGEGRIWFVIEQDGRVHDSKRMSGKDEARNRHYADACIPCIVMSTRAIRSEGVTAAEYLDREMAKILGAAGHARHQPEQAGGGGGGSG